MIRTLDLAHREADDKLQETIDRHHGLPLEELVATQRAFVSLRYGIRGVISEPCDGPTLKETDRIAFVPGAFAWPIRKPDIGSQFLADLHEMPVVAVTSPITSRHFGMRDRLAIAQGDFRPYSEQYLKFLDAKIAYAGKVAVMGQSMGATLGMNLAARGANYLDFASVTVGEPPNAVKRTALELARALKDDGFDETHRHILASSIRAHIEARRINDPYRELRDLMKFAGNAVLHLPSNLWAGLGMARNTFERDLSAVEAADIPTVVAFGRESTIARASVMRAIANRHQSTTWVEVCDSDDKAGHTWGDDLRAWAAITQV